MRPGPRLTRDRRGLYVVLAVLFAVAATHRVRDTIDRLEELVRGDEIARLPFADIDLPAFSVSVVLPESAAAGFQPGDVIVAVNGEPFRGGTQLFTTLRYARPESNLQLTVRRGDGEAPPSTHTGTIRLEPIQEEPPTALQVLGALIGFVALPYLCLCLGFWVAALRIHDRLAWLVLLMLLSLAEFVGGHWRTLFGRDDWFQVVSGTYQPLLANLWPASMMLFGLYFPDRLPVDRRHPWLKWVVIVPILFRVAGTNVALDFLVRENRDAAIEIDRLFGWTATPVFVLHFLAISIFFAAIGFRAFTERKPDARRRLMLLHAGAFVAITPLCIMFVLAGFGVLEFEQWMALPLLALLFIFPATMAYVIVVHRAMDVRLVIRQGLQYLFARGTVRAIQMILSVLILAAAATAGAAANTASRIALIAAALAMVLLVQKPADRLRRWIDRRFFREAYDAEQILTDLANKVRTMVETRPLLETVANQVSRTLHVPRIAILLDGGGMLEPAYAIGYPSVPRVPSPPAELPPDTHRELRQALDAELLLPLASNQKLIGLMSLGPKQSEEPFTKGDIRLLDAVAAQTGLALENSRLTTEIANEVANREKAKRELEIAREVQERLFPQDYPALPGIEYAGACRPALGVGGDYYDFIPLSGTDLGIAIGDVSGKGIPAALLMATLRAYLRGQTAAPGASNLAAMIVNLNRLVYESSAPNRYATFFYGQYDAATGVLAYVNAGHNPPIVLRAAGGIDRLDTGGPVVGLLPECRYEQGCVRLEAGDVFIAFTDGVSEAMTASYEEWGEERLLDAIRAARGLQSRALIERIMHGADEFVAGAAQHDDMTLVVVRREGSGAPASAGPSAPADGGQTPVTGLTGV